MPDAPEHIIEGTPVAFSLSPMLPQLPAMETPAALDAPATAKKPRRQRQHVEQFRTDDAEHDALEARARESGLSIGAFMRACALGDAGPRARKRPPVDRELLARANADLNRVGNNLNQIAHALNSDDDVPAAEIVAAAAELRETLATLRRALGYDRQG